MNYLKRVISTMLILALVITSCIISDTVQVNAAAEKEIYKDNNCRITFKVNSQWDSALEGQFIIENIGTEILKIGNSKLLFLTKLQICGMER